MRYKLLVALLFIAASAFGQLTTGELGGTAVDQSGSALPGVTVTAAGLGAPLVQVTDAEGRFAFFALNPGTYKVTGQLEGFGPAQQTVTINLGRTTYVELTLRPALSETMTVTADAPVVDVTSSSIDTNLGTRAIETLPTGRNYSSIAQVVPGVASDANPNNKDQNSITVYGSSGADNAFYVDGVNTTNVEYGFQGKELNFEFIREVNVKTGGYEAEFGRATGGIINVITKSGGNELTGDVFGYYDSDSLQADAEQVVDTTLAGFTRGSSGADLGGPIVRDKLWFFAESDRVKNATDNILPEGPRAGQIETTNSDRDLGSGKLTYNFSAGQSLMFTFLQDPR